MHKVDEQVRQSCRRHGVKLYQYANVGNHLHLVIRTRHRRGWAAFIRELTGRIAQLASNQKGFWAFRPFTRVVKGWGRAYRAVKSYVHANAETARGGKRLRAKLERSMPTEAEYFEVLRREFG